VEWAGVKTLWLEGGDPWGTQRIVRKRMKEKGLWRFVRMEAVASDEWQDGVAKNEDLWLEGGDPGCFCERVRKLLKRNGLRDRAVQKSAKECRRV